MGSFSDLTRRESMFDRKSKLMNNLACMGGNDGCAQQDAFFVGDEFDKPIVEIARIASGDN